MILHTNEIADKYENKGKSMEHVLSLSATSCLPLPFVEAPTNRKPPIRFQNQLADQVKTKSSTQVKIFPGRSSRRFRNFEQTSGWPPVDPSRNLGHIQALIGSLEPSPPLRHAVCFHDDKLLKSVMTVSPVRSSAGSSCCRGHHRLGVGWFPSKEEDNRDFGIYCVEGSRSTGDGGWKSHV
ncbi:hypothetical protein U1Q18_011418 [Sarracenia purpurea var. burkii]